MVRDVETNDPINLTGKTALLRFKLNNGTVAERSMTVLNQATALGQAEYQFTTMDLPSAGQVVMEVVVQDGQPDQLTTVDKSYVRVVAPLA